MRKRRKAKKKGKTRQDMAGQNNAEQIRTGQNGSRDR